MAQWKNTCSSGSKAGRYVLLLTLNTGAQSIDNNTTYVEYSLQLAGGNYWGDNLNPYGSSFYGYVCYGSISITNALTGVEIGTGSGSSSGTISNSSAQTIAYGSAYLPHNSDGTLTINIASSFSGGYSEQASGGSVFGSLTIPTIPRATECPSNITLTTDVTNSITIAPKSTAFTHTMELKIGSTTYSLGSSVAGATTINATIPNNVYANANLLNGGSGTLYLKTYSGGVQIGGTQSKTCTINVNANQKPDLALGVYETNTTLRNLIGDDAGILANHNSIKFSFLTEFKPQENPATLKNIVLKLNNDATSITLNDDDDYTYPSDITSAGIKATLTDSRNMTFTHTLTEGTDYVFIPYVDVSSSLVVSRPTQTGTTMSVTYSGNWYNQDVGTTQNELSLALYCREQGELTWTQVTLTNATIQADYGDNSYSFTELVDNPLDLDGEWDYQKVYEFYFSATDLIRTALSLGRVSTERKIVTKGIPDFVVYPDTAYLHGIELTGGGGGASGDTLPIGSIMPYTKATAPTNWLICDGSAVSRLDYSQLFAVIGTTYGAGDGSTTFNLPDLRGRVAVGKSSDAEFDTLGETGGEKTHSLTINEMPSHNHTFYQTPDSHTATWIAGVNRYFYDVNTTSDSQTYLGSTSSTGSGNAHNNLQPYQVFNYIIKCGNSSGVFANVSNTYATSTTDTYSCAYVNNINNNFIQKKYIKVRQTIDQQLNSGTMNVVFQAVDVNVGNGFALTAGGYANVTDTSIKKVKVTCQMWVERGSTSYAWCRIYRNNWSLSNGREFSSAMIPARNNGDVWQSVTMTTIVDVDSNNPIIYPNVTFNVSSADNKVRGGTYSNSVYMILEAID